MDSTWIIVGGFAAVVVAFQVFRRLGQISGDEAHALVQGGARLVDVRTPGEFSQGHLPGAVNVPLQELGARLGKLGAKDTPVVLYCASGARSALARSVLKGSGFRQVFNLGSMGRW
ncbi:MAG: rhodanese-like domain-containing protein [Myxococcales bacterium]|nr:rhodanese-like domain-containing protein [Myxococcales bacterium]